MSQTNNKIKTREELQKQYQKNILRIWNKYHIQPTTTLEYIYMNQSNPKEAKQMLQLEIERTLLYQTINYNNYSDTVQNTMKKILNELKR